MSSVQKALPLPEIFYSGKSKRKRGHLRIIDYPPNAHFMFRRKQFAS